MTTRTPSSPRATRLRRNLVEKAASSLTPRSRPRTSRSLSVRTAVATTIARLTTRQSSRTVRYLALSQTYGSVVSPRRVWNASIRVSNTPQIGDIPLLLTPVMPRTRTRPSSFRVLTPQHVRLLDHPTERLFIAPAGCRKRRIVRAVAEFRNRQRYRPRASVPAPLPIPIPSDGPVGRPLMALRADLGAHVRLRQLLQRSDHGAQQELGLLDPVLLQQILQGGTRLSYAGCVLSRGAPPPRGPPGGFLGESTSSYLHVWWVSSPAPAAERPLGRNRRRGTVGGRCRPLHPAFRQGIGGAPGWGLPHVRRLIPPLHAHGTHDSPPSGRTRRVGLVRQPHRRVLDVQWPPHGGVGSPPNSGGRITWPLKLRLRCARGPLVIAFGR